MAHICNTSDGTPWTSEVSGNPDGEISIGDEQGNGRFEGRRKKSGEPDRDLHGRCFEVSAGLPDRIWFVVPQNDHLYMGVFQTRRRIIGVRFSLRNLVDSLRDPKLDVVVDDEDWVGTKT